MINEKAKIFLSFLIRFGISALLLFYLFSKIDIGKFAGILKAADPVYIFYAFLFFLLSNAVILYRWLIFIRALELDSPLEDVIRYFFIGLFGNLFLPSGVGGDLIKAMGLCKSSSRKARVIASVVLDRLSGFAAVIIVSVIVYVLGYRLIGAHFLLIPIMMLAGISLTLALILFNEKIFSFVSDVFKRIPKIKDALMKLHYDISLIRHQRARGYLAVGLSCLTQVLSAATLFFISKAVHQDIGIIYFLVFTPMICVASSLPSLGGLGVRDWGARELFGRIGVDSGIAVSFTLINYLFMVLIGILGGVVYVITVSSGRLQHHSPDPGIVPKNP